MSQWGCELPHVPTVASLSGRLLARVLPEVLVEVLVFEDAEHQRFVIMEHRHQMARTIERHDSAKERLPASTIRRRFESHFVPLAIQQVERDPLMEQHLIDVLNRIVLLDVTEPATRSMKPNRGRMVATDDCQTLFVRRPSNPQCVNGWGRFVHVTGSRSVQLGKAFRLHQKYPLRVVHSTAGLQSDLNGHSVGDDVQSDSLVPSINSRSGRLDRRNRFE